MSIFPKPPIYLPFGVYINLSPIGASPAYPYAVSLKNRVDFMEWTQSFYLNGPNNATNYWNIYLMQNVSGIILASFTTVGYAIATGIVYNTTTINPYIPGADMGLMVTCIKTGAPGTFFLFGPLLQIVA